MLQTIFNALSSLFGNTFATIIAIVFFTILFIIVVYIIGQIFIIKEHLQNIDNTNKEILEELKKTNSKDNKDN